jgi:hypothetical protein
VKLLFPCRPLIGQRKGDAVDLSGRSRNGLPEGRRIAQHRIADARELVGQGAGCLVVVGSPLHLQPPFTQAIQRSSGACRQAGRPQHGAGAVGEQHSEIAVPALGDTPEPSVTPRGKLLRRKPEPTEPRRLSARERGQVSYCGTMRSRV